MSSEPIKGRAWVFGDNIDTDVMFPGRALRLPPEEAVELLFDAIRPGWSRLVGTGDLVIGGSHFGLGSARPVGTLFRMAGVAAVLASSMSSLFQRNCINAGVLAYSVPGIVDMCSEGDVLEADAETGVIRNLTTGAETSIAPLPKFVTEIAFSGGLVAQLVRRGYLRG